MSGGFQIGSEEEIKKTVVQLKGIALKALQSYDLDWEQIHFNQLSDTCTFIIRANKEGAFLLRIHSGMNREEIDSEIVWLNALNERVSFPLPQGVLDRNGFRTIKIDLENDTHVYASLMRWVEGKSMARDYRKIRFIMKGCSWQISIKHHSNSKFPLTLHAPHGASTVLDKRWSVWHNTIISF